MEALIRVAFLKFSNGGKLHLSNEVLRDANDEEVLI